MAKQAPQTTQNEIKPTAGEFMKAALDKLCFSIFLHRTDTSFSNDTTLKEEEDFKEATQTFFDSHHPLHRYHIDQVRPSIEYLTLPKAPIASVFTGFVDKLLDQLEALDNLELSQINYTSVVFMICQHITAKMFKQYVNDELLRIGRTNTTTFRDRLDMQDETYLGAFKNLLAGFTEDSMAFRYYLDARDCEYPIESPELAIFESSPNMRGLIYLEGNQYDEYFKIDLRGLDNTDNNPKFQLGYFDPKVMRQLCQRALTRFLMVFYCQVLHRPYPNQSNQSQLQEELNQLVTDKIAIDLFIHAILSLAFDSIHAGGTNLVFAELGGYTPTTTYQQYLDKIMSDTKIHMAFGYAIALKEYINDQPAWALDYKLAYCPDIYTRTHKLSNPVEFYQTAKCSQRNKTPNYDPDRQGEICLIGRTGATIVMLFKLLPDKLLDACVADISTSCLKGPTDDKGYITAEVVVTVRSWSRPGTQDAFIDTCDDTTFRNRGLLVHSPAALTKFINNNRGWTLCRRHEHVLNQMETERAVMRGLIERSLGAKFGVSNRLKLIDDVPDALM